jgi:hypothetical protein
MADTIMDQTQKKMRELSYNWLLLFCYGEAFSESIEGRVGKRACEGFIQETEGQEAGQSHRPGRCFRGYYLYIVF